MTRFWQNNIEQMGNIYEIFGKVLFTINDPLPILPGNEQDLDHKRSSQHLLVLPSVQSV